uniref:Putative O-succinylbenzoate--CoA ligase n=1 Tax=Weissella thailandensis fsh4-2 TaxID=1056112 RepID=G0UEY4_9LACO|nr:putative O-succinylbenzoate--CoA ligase [Weissella thailandensis fsh4-2]
MTTLTKQLTEQLQIHKDDELIKDLQLDQWFTGQQLADDVTTLYNFFREIGLMHQDLSLVCLDNSAVYPVLTQAFWQLGVVEHPVAATTPIAQLLAEFNEHTYAVIVVKKELADQLTDQVPLQKQIVKLNTNQHFFRKIETILFIH